LARERTLLTVKSYGRITVKLKELMDKQGVSRNALARSIGSRFEVIDRLYSGEVEKLDLDVLARICCVMECKVEDIIEYTGK